MATAAEHKKPNLHCEDVAARWARIEQRVDDSWRFGDDVLEAARPTLRKRMLQLDAELTKDPVFSKMLPLDPCDFLWILFSTDGTPGTDPWRKTWDEKSGLRNLQLQDVYVVVAAIELEIAAFALLEHHNLAGKEDVDEDGAMQALAIASGSLGSAEKALALAEGNAFQDPLSQLH